MKHENGMAAMGIFRLACALLAIAILSGSASCQYANISPSQGAKEDANRTALQPGLDSTADMQVEFAPGFYYRLNGSDEVGFLDANKSVIEDCAKIQTVLEKSYFELRSAPYLKGEFAKDIEEFDRVRGLERSCRFTLGFEKGPCIDFESCFRDCFVMPMCGDLAYSEFFVNFSMHIYNVTADLDNAVEECKSAAKTAKAPADFLAMQGCLNAMELRALDYLASPLVGNRKGALEFCGANNYSFGAIGRMRERIRQIAMAQAVDPAMRAEYLCTYSQSPSYAQQVERLKPLALANLQVSEAFEKSRARLQDIIALYPNCVDLSGLQAELSENDRLLAQMQDESQRIGIRKEKTGWMNAQADMLDSKLGAAIQYCDCSARNHRGTDAGIETIEQDLIDCQSESPGGNVAQAGAQGDAPIGGQEDMETLRAQWEEFDTHGALAIVVGAWVALIIAALIARALGFGFGKKQVVYVQTKLNRHARGVEGGGALQTELEENERGHQANEQAPARYMAHSMPAGRPLFGLLGGGKKEVVHLQAPGNSQEGARIVSKPAVFGLFGSQGIVQAHAKSFAHSMPAGRPLFGLLGGGKKEVVYMQAPAGGENVHVPAFEAHRAIASGKARMHQESASGAEHDNWRRRENQARAYDRIKRANAGIKSSYSGLISAFGAVYEYAASLAAAILRAAGRLVLAALSWPKKAIGGAAGASWSAGRAGWRAGIAAKSPSGAASGALGKQAGVRVGIERRLERAIALIEKIATYGFSAIFRAFGRSDEYVSHAFMLPIRMIIASMEYAARIAGKLASGASKIGRELFEAFAGFFHDSGKTQARGQEPSSHPRGDYNANGRRNAQKNAQTDSARKRSLESEQDKHMVSLGEIAEIERKRKRHESG